MLIEKRQSPLPKLAPWSWGREETFDLNIQVQIGAVL